MAVISSARLDAAAANLIDAAVADVGPIRAAVLNQAHGTRGSRLVIESDALAELDHSIVRASERQRQKTLRVEHRQRHLGKRLFERCDGNLCGSCAVGVPTHAVDDYHQQRFAAGHEVDAILILRSIARQGQLCIIDAHALVPSPRLHTLIVVTPAASRGVGAQSGWQSADVHSVSQRWTALRLAETTSGLNRMPHSMTGFSTAEARVGSFRFVWEIRSVNHRFLELGFRLPDELRAVEPECREIVGTAIKRGKVDCTLKIGADERSAAADTIVAGALERLRRLEEH